MAHANAPLSPERKAQLADARTRLQEDERKGWQHLDNVVFKIAAGGLAVSVTFLGVTSGTAPGSMPWVYVAWVLWVVSLASLMLSVVTGQLGLRSMIRHIDAGSFDRTTSPEGRLGACTPALNNVAVATCGIGLVCLLIFAVMNVSGGNTMTEKISVPDNLGQRGQVAPQVQPAQPVFVPDTPGAGGGQVAPQVPPPTTAPASTPSEGGK